MPLLLSIARAAKASVRVAGRHVGPERIELDLEEVVRGDQRLYRFPGVAAADLDRLVGGRIEVAGRGLYDIEGYFFNTPINCYGIGNMADQGGVRLQQITIQRICVGLCHGGNAPPCGKTTEFDNREPFGSAAERAAFPSTGPRGCRPAGRGDWIRVKVIVASTERGPKEPAAPRENLQVWTRRSGRRGV